MTADVQEREQRWFPERRKRTGFRRLPKGKSEHGRKDANKGRSLIMTLGGNRSGEIPLHKRACMVYNPR